MFHAYLVPLIAIICFKGARRLCTFPGIFKEVTSPKSEGLLYLHNAGITVHSRTKQIIHSVLTACFDLRGHQQVDKNRRYNTQFWWNFKRKYHNLHPKMCS